MKGHSEVGYRILRNGGTPLFELAAQIARYHHERWDGSGYPAGLAGEAIPEGARMVASADVFDALTMKRPYKEPWSVEESVAEIERGAGSHFEPRLVTLFVEHLPRIIELKERWDREEHRLIERRDGEVSKCP